MTSFLVTDTIIHSISQLIDDSNNNGVYREPSHSDIEFQIVAAGLSEYDPKQRGQTIGKAKRIRAVLYAARDADPAHSTRFVTGLLGKIRASGGFRPSSMNYVGEEAIENAKAAFFCRCHKPRNRFLRRPGDSRPGAKLSLRRFGQAGIFRGRSTD